MNTYFTILVLVMIISLIVIGSHYFSTIVYHKHSRHIREHSLNHLPIVQVGKEWEEVYEPGDSTPFGQDQDYNQSESE